MSAQALKRAGTGRHRCPSDRAIAVLVALIAGALLVAGCGSSSPPSSSTGSHAAATNPSEQVVAFASCMRSHGLSSYPDPEVSQSGNSTRIKISPGSLDPNSSAFKAASHRCGHLLPAGGAPSAPTPQEEAQDLLYARCLRSHGVPGFPDPDHDGVFTLPSVVDQQAPQFRHAKQACAKLEPSSLSILTQSPAGS
jgi:hypothetical protein